MQTNTSGKVEKDKIDSALRDEIARLEKEGRTGQRLEVVIEHAGRSEAGAPSGAGREQVAGSVRHELKRRLDELGAEGVRELALANALVARLTPSQIRTLAKDPWVKRIFSNVPEKVTLGNS